MIWGMTVDPRRLTSGRNLKHGLCYTPEYRAWAEAIRRCENPRNPGFANYGGRGIKMAPEWRHDFAAFFAHIGPRPGSLYTLDRIDNGGNYEPGNVRWATYKVQANNTRRNKR